MKLNKEGRDELRERISQKLKDVDFNPDKRIILPKEMLEELLFDVDYDLEGIKRKRIGYHYDGLDKLDLSKISFNDVSFNSKKYRINLSNTNAKIDFFKTYEWRKSYGNLLCIHNIDFSNVDLSNNEFVKTKEIENILAVITECNFSNTKIHLYYFPITFEHCDLSNNDFSGLYLDPKPVEDQPSRIIFENGPLTMEDCNLANTGIKIGYNYDKLDFNPLFEKGYFDGCYFNGTKIKTREEAKKDSDDLLKKYSTYKSKRINKMLDLIDDQLASNGGRVVNHKEECNGVGSFYGCGNEPETKKKKKTLNNNCGSAYGCDNVPEEPTK